MGTAAAWAWRRQVVGAEREWRADGQEGMRCGRGKGEQGAGRGEMRQGEGAWGQGGGSSEVIVRSGITHEFQVESPRGAVYDVYTWDSHLSSLAWRHTHAHTNRGGGRYWGA